jgi:hypothetical protein
VAHTLNAVTNPPVPLNMRISLQAEEILASQEGHFFLELVSLIFISLRSPSLFYLLTVGVDVVHFHLITLRHTPQSVGFLWTRDRPVVETST